MDGTTVCAFERKNGEGDFTLTLRKEFMSVIIRVYNGEEILLQGSRKVYRQGIISGD